MSFQWRLEYVWPEEYLVDLETALVLTGEIRRTQDIPIVLSLVNTAFPLHELKHLKRVRRKISESTSEKTEPKTEIIVKWAALDQMEGSVVSTATGLSDCSSRESLLPFLHESMSVHRVCRSRPLTKQQLAVSKNFWSTCNLNPLVCLETHGLDPVRRQVHERFLNLLTERNVQNFINSCVENEVIIVDPSSRLPIFNSLTYHDKQEISKTGNPLCHPLMKAIDYIASRQRLSIGKRPASDAEIPPATEESYLCTGYYCYLLREPCVMCAMALVHARIGCVVFLQDAPEDGALKSVFKLQGIKNLNHHFEVWQAHRLPSPAKPTES